MLRFVFQLLVCMALLPLLGCGSGMSSSEVQEVQALFDKAIASEKGGNLDEAFLKIDQAISQGGLNPDQLAEAYLLRSRCQSTKGNLDAAWADLEFAEQGSPNPAGWHFSRGVYFAAKGDAAKSKSEFATARRLDPSLKIPK